jgi:hypothetical protein
MPFKSRLRMMHRAGWSTRESTNPTAFAWFVSDREHDRSAATVRRLDWPGAIRHRPMRGASLKGSCSGRHPNTPDLVCAILGHPSSAMRRLKRDTRASCCLGESIKE